MATKQPTKPKAAAKPSRQREPINGADSADAEVQHTHSEPQATGTDVVTRETGGAIALSERLGRHAARQREELGKAPSSLANMLSFRGGTITLEQENLGSSIPVIILATQFERSYYPGAYIAGEAVTPSCYSRDNITPHPEAPFKQSDACQSCPMNQFESAREGSGKACKEGLKLAMVHAANVVGGSSAVDRPGIVQARLSVLNAMAVKQDLKAIQAQVPQHTIQAYTTLKVQPDQRSQYKASLVFDGFTEEAVVNQLEPLIDPALDMLNAPYPANMAKDPAEAGKTKDKAASARRTSRF
jgi:hypothetical protein